MESVFYKYGHKKRFPVSYLALELLAKSVENSGSEATLEQALAPVLSALGQKPPYSTELLTGFAEDLKTIQESKKDSSDSKPAKSSSKNRSFGEEFVSWFGKLNIDASLYLLAGYDFQKACDLYCNTPVIVVDKMLSTKFEHEWNSLEAGFESVVLGMGGKISRKGSGAGKTHEVPKTETETIQRDQQLRRLGF